MCVCVYTPLVVLVPRSVLALGRERPEIPCFGCVISNTVAIIIWRITTRGMF
jgi:hypothetical protein